MCEILSVSISLIALFVSSIVAYIQHNQRKIMHNASLNSKYHDEIFLEHLIHGIPETRRYIRFSDAGKLEDTDNLCEELNSMLNDALYYKYNDKDFYTKLKNSVQNIEDYVMECGNKRFDPDEQSDVYKSIQQKLEELYRLINVQYVGKYI